MSKVSEVSNTVLNKRLKAMSKVSKVVFVAFMQLCILSNVTHVACVKSELYSIYRAPCPSRREFSL